LRPTADRAVGPRYSAPRPALYASVMGASRRAWKLVYSGPAASRGAAGECQLLELHCPRDKYAHESQPLSSPCLQETHQPSTATAEIGVADVNRPRGIFLPTTERTRAGASRTMGDRARGRWLFPASGYQAREYSKRTKAERAEDRALLRDCREMMAGLSGKYHRSRLLSTSLARGGARSDSSLADTHTRADRITASCCGLTGVADLSG
jgi:hypothetical protein